MKSVLVLCVGLVLVSPAAARPFQGYMKIEGVKGEVTAAPHTRWMEITGISSLPEACNGDEGGGSITVRVVQLPDRRQLPMLGGLDGAAVHFDVVDTKGKPLKMTFEQVYVSNNFSGSPHHPILIGLTAADGSPADKVELMTLNFKHVTWERPDCPNGAE